jgi:hypothetical protein
MDRQPLPYTLEDRTGSHTASDYDDIYDRIFLRIADSPQQADRRTLVIYKMTRRASPRRDSLPFNGEPCVALEFGPNNTLGVISFYGRPTVAAFSAPMTRYLRRTGIFSGSIPQLLLLPREF